MSLWGFPQWLCGFLFTSSKQAFEMYVLVHLSTVVEFFQVFREILWQHQDTKTWKVDLNR